MGEYGKSMENTDKFLKPRLPEEKGE